MSDILYISLPRVERTTALYDRHAVGLILPGDERIVPRRWWNRWLIRALVPMSVAVLAPGPADILRGYRIGIARNGSDPRITRRPRHDRIFAILLWRETTLVFITNREGTEEGRLSFVRRQTRASAENDGVYIAPV